MKYMETGLMVVIADGLQVVTILNNESHYDKVIRLLHKSKFGKVRKLLDKIRNRISESSGGVMETVIEESGSKKILIDGEDADPVILEYLEKIDAGTDRRKYEALIELDRNIKKCKSSVIRPLLSRFISEGDFPVTEDGCFIAYKALRLRGDGNLVDFYSGRLVQNIGTVVKLKKGEYDENPQSGCSRGLHVGSFSYVRRMYGERQDAVFVALKVNPAHCINVPIEERGKIRVHTYTVLGLMPKLNKFGNCFNPWTSEFSEQEVKVLPGMNLSKGDKEQITSLDLTGLSASAMVKKVHESTSVYLDLKDTKNKEFVKKRILERLSSVGISVKF